MHESCPCSHPSLGGCKCIRGDSSCDNGHHWFICPVDRKTVMGKSNHAVLGKCECNDTAFYRDYAKEEEIRYPETVTIVMTKHQAKLFH
jgi:hypothetical protein